MVAINAVVVPVLCTPVSVEGREGGKEGEREGGREGGREMERWRE